MAACIVDEHGKPKYCHTAASYTLKLTIKYIIDQRACMCVWNCTGCGMCVCTQLYEICMRPDAREYCAGVHTHTHAHSNTHTHTPIVCLCEQTCANTLGADDATRTTQRSLTCIYYVCRRAHTHTPQAQPMHRHYNTHTQTYTRTHSRTNALAPQRASPSKPALKAFTDKLPLYPAHAQLFSLLSWP